MLQVWTAMRKNCGNWRGYSVWTMKLSTAPVRDSGRVGLAQTLPAMMAERSCMRLLAVRAMRRNFWPRLLVFCHSVCLCALLACQAYAAPRMACVGAPFLAAEDDINLYCLRASYPQIVAVEKGRAGKMSLLLNNGARVAYAETAPRSGLGGSALAADIRASLAQPYYLEPERPPTPPGCAPGRQRPYALLHALYGQDAKSARQNMRTLRWQGKNITMAAAALPAMQKVMAELEPLLGDARLKAWLVPDGAFYWRRIAGESALSAHSFGIAIDIGAKKAPYWRWSGKMPHPLQKDYPSAIVSAFERNGFIWGGKWHEYDLMHFEYRPELICKARLKAARQNGL